MIEDKGEIFLASPYLLNILDLKLQSHQTVHGTDLKHGMSTTVTDGGWTTLWYTNYFIRAW